MATVFKRTYWVDATGKKVAKETPGAIERTSRFYSIRYSDTRGRPQACRGYADQRASNQLAARLEKSVALGNEGMIDPFADTRRQLLTEHLKDYLAALALRGRSAKYQYVTNKRITKIIKETEWKTFDDITLEKFDEWRSARVGKPRSSGKSLNQHLDAISAMLNWGASKLVKRFPNNPLQGTPKLPHFPTFQRQAIHEADLAKLFDAAPIERRRIYFFAVATGLRRQEIEDLQWGDVVIDTPIPFLALRDYATKARRADTFGLRAEVVEMLRELRPANFSDTGKVFQDGVPAVETLLTDLRLAGVEVPEEGGLDRIDFHALRTTLGSLIGKVGISERVGMELLRVTDPRLLRKTYCDPRVFETARAAQAIPIPNRRPTTGSQTLRATGTDGTVNPPECAQNSPVNMRREATPDAAISKIGKPPESHKPLPTQGLTPSDDTTRRDLPKVAKAPRTQPCS